MFEFAPQVGSSTQRLARLARAIALDKHDALEGLASFVDEQMSLLMLGEVASPDVARLLFSYSILLDIVGVGGDVAVRDSRIFVSWPDWEGPAGREAAGRALRVASNLRDLDSAEIDRVRPLFAPDTDGSDVAVALAEGRFWLEGVESTHPSGVRYSEGFSAALRLWTMPYRGRQGRQKRFVLLCEHHVFGAHPVIAGILEMGDEAPFCSWRDSLLGLDGASFLGWLKNQPSSSKAALPIAKRLQALRRALRPTRIAPGLGSLDAATLVGRMAELETRAAGRSLTDHASEGRKRIAYAIRLARGEVALREIGCGAENLDVGQLRALSAGVRAIHDLTIPRVHMEACVCGPVPPFSHGLGGKLMVAFLAHPSIVDLPTASKGTVLEQSFDLGKIEPFLPHHGMLAVTTKGLYARHAPMYNRAQVPGVRSPLRLRHIQNTDGTTTSFISDRSSRLARLVLEHSPDQARRQVSFKYGSGGAKRHRSIENAARLIDLPADLVSAGIRRPVYALPLVVSPPDVIWRGVAPEWLIRRGENAESYSERAVDMWRKQWLPRAMARASEYAFIPSPIRFFGAHRAESASF